MSRAWFRLYDGPALRRRSHALAAAEPIARSAAKYQPNRAPSSASRLGRLTRSGGLWAGVVGLGTGAGDHVEFLKKPCGFCDPAARGLGELAQDVTFGNLGDDPAVDTGVQDRESAS